MPDPQTPPHPLDPLATARDASQRAVLDVRAADLFAAGHLAGSGHIPWPELPERRYELPRRERALLVVAEDGARARAAAEWLAAMGLSDVAFLDAQIEEVPHGLASREPAARLWNPTPYLVERLPSIPRGRALDLASGSGRDAVYLALEGFDVEAWDLDRTALAWADALARRNGVRLATVERDLESRLGAPDARFALIVCFRFLQRSLLPWIESALAPGGHLVYETFRAGQGRFGRPHQRRFLLDSGELRAAFAGLEVLHYDEPEPPGGPWTARLHARSAADPIGDSGA